jgi:hypothetical protein
MALAATMVAGVLLAGCAKHPATRPTAPAATTRSTSVTGAGATTTTRHEHHAASQGGSNEAALPDQTGIAACDDYLSSYLACHRAAGIFAPDQLQSRYEAMRTNLLRDSQNPDVRPQLAERCNSLARSLRDALHGKSCAANPTPAASSP